MSVAAHLLKLGQRVIRHIGTVLDKSIRRLVRGAAS